MAFNINEFRASLSKVGGVMRPTLYTVVITPPAALSDPIISSIPLLCDSIELPGFSFQTESFKHKGYGIEDRRPTAAVMEDAPLTFISDGKARLSKFFDRWSNWVYDLHRDEQDGTERFRYPVEYHGTIEAYVYDAAGNKVSTYKYKEAWPIAVGNIRMAWSENDTYAILPVQFAFKSHVVKTTEGAGLHTTPISLQTGVIDRSVQAIQNAIAPPSIPEYIRRLESI